MNFAIPFESAFPYEEFLLKYGSPSHQANWRAVYDRASLTESQREILSRFTRSMKLLCFAGAWCGDCVEQCPLLQRIAEGSPTIDLRFVDRDADDLLKAEMSLCGGARVPQVVFLDEEGLFVGHYGDRTLSKYRRMVAKLDEAGCSTGLFQQPDDVAAEVLGEWFAEIERVQWMLRTSGRLREKHGE